MIKEIIVEKEKSIYTYFVAFTYRTQITNLFGNGYWDLDYEIKDSEDIEKIENELRNYLQKNVDGFTGDVFVINYKLMSQRCKGVI